MAILTGLEILRQIDASNILIEPFDLSHLNPNSVDLRLADTLLYYTLPPCFPITCLDARKPNPTEKETIGADGFILRPGVLYLASTLEWTETRCFVPCIEGKSSLGRLGIDIHKTAGFGDVGFSGNWTLEISVVHPVKIYAGMRFCQIVYHTVEGKITPYRGKYQGQDAVTPSRSHLDFKEIKQQ